MWFLFAFLSGLLGAILAIIVKLYLKHINICFLSFIFFLIASLMLLIIGMISHKISCPLISQLTAKDILVLLIAGIINASAFSFYLYAINTGNVSNVVAIDRLGILYVVILSFIILKDALTIKSIIGSVLMILGAFLLS